MAMNRKEATINITYIEHMFLTNYNYIITFFYQLSTQKNNKKRGYLLITPSYNYINLLTSCRTLL